MDTHAIIRFLSVAALVTFFAGLLNILATAKDDHWRIVILHLPLNRKRIAVLSIVLTVLGGVLSEVQQAKSSALASHRTEETLNWLTGGDDFCFLDILPVNDASIQELFLRRVGVYPIYDVEIEVTDEERLSGLPQRSFPTSTQMFAFLDSAKTHIHVGNVPPEGARPTPTLTKLNITIPLTPADRHTLQVSITARNGPFKETLELGKTAGFWNRSIVVTRLGREASQALYACIDKNFPEKQRNAPVCLGNH